MSTSGYLLKVLHFITLLCAFTYFCDTVKVRPSENLAAANLADLTDCQDLRPSFLEGKSAQCKDLKADCINAVMPLSWGQYETACIENIPITELSKVNFERLPFIRPLETLKKAAAITKNKSSTPEQDKAAREVAKVILSSAGSRFVGSMKEDSCVIFTKELLEDLTDLPHDVFKHMSEECMKGFPVDAFGSKGITRYIKGINPTAFKSFSQDQAAALTDDNLNEITSQQFKYWGADPPPKTPRSKKPSADQVRQEKEARKLAKKSSHPCKALKDKETRIKKADAYEAFATRCVYWNSSGVKMMHNAGFSVFTAFIGVILGSSLLSLLF